MNRLDAMNLFVRVADLGSFAAAANQLGVARSVVTRQIAALEEHLGVKLMVRTTRRLTLTTAGTEYLRKCRTILDLVEAAEAEVMEARLTPRGALRISLPLSYGLKRVQPLLPEFLSRYPEISLALDFSDRLVNLIDEGIDLSIRVASRLEPGDVARQLASVRLLAVAAPAYLRQHGCPQHPQELANHSCLGYSIKGANRPLSFLIDGEIRPIHLSYRMQANNGDALASAAVSGLGITVQPDFIANDHLASGALVSILDDFAVPALGVYALLPSNRYLPHRVRVLIDFLAAGLSTPTPIAASAQ